MFCSVFLGWEVFEVWNVAGKFGTEGLYGCLHDIQEDDGDHVVTLLYSCFVVNLTHCFSKFQLHETFQVEFFDHAYLVIWYSIFGEDEEHARVITVTKALTRLMKRMYVSRPCCLLRIRAEWRACRASGYLM